MSERERLVGYVSGDTALEVEKLADRNDQSVSEFVASAVSEKVEREQLGALTEEYSVEMKLLRLVESATDRVVDETAESVADELITEFDDRGLLEAESETATEDSQWSVS